MGITEEELAETIHLVASVGAGRIVAMADRASKKILSAGENKLSELLR